MGVIKNFIKKYAALLPSIGLLIAAILLLLPTLHIGSRVKAKMDSSVKQHQSIRSNLIEVPSRQMPEQISAYMQRLESEASEIDALIQQSSQRELIAWNIFPEPKDTSAQIYLHYGRNYQAAIEAMIERLNALDAPSENEIRQRTGGARPGTGMGGAFGMPGAVRPAQAQDPVVDALCLARAESISVYANPSVLAWYGFWQQYQFQGKEDALKDCWNSQVAFWIYDDVVKTIEAMNAGSSRVSASSVKRLLGVSFSGPVAAGAGRPGESFYAVAGAGQTPAGRDNPNFVTEALPSAFMASQPWTGRVGGANQDIVHFAVSVILDSRYVLAFMQELCSEKPHVFRADFNPDNPLTESVHNQITILQSAVYAIDKQDAQHELYRYGDGSAMRLDVVCEYIFDRKGYDAMKPEPIKVLLGQSADAAASTGSPSSPGVGFPGGFGMPGM